MPAVINVVARHGDTIDVVVTFIDDSGHGLARVWAETEAGEALMERGLSPDCPPTYQAPIAGLRPDQVPFFAYAQSCGSDSATPERSVFGPDLFFVPIPVEPTANPCLPEFGTMETEEFARQQALITSHVDTAEAIAAEIADLCAERAVHDADRRDHNRKMNAFFGAAAATAVAGLILIAALPAFWWIGLLVLAVAAGLFIAGKYHEQEADRARREIERIDGLIEDAQERYREAVLEATRANCGAVPGLAVVPPDCS